MRTFVENRLDDFKENSSVPSKVLVIIAMLAMAGAAIWGFILGMDFRFGGLGEAIMTVIYGAFGIIMIGLPVIIYCLILAALLNSIHKCTTNVMSVILALLSVAFAVAMYAGVTLLVMHLEVYPSNIGAYTAYSLGLYQGAGFLGVGLILLAQGGSRTFPRFPAGRLPVVLL